MMYRVLVADDEPIERMIVGRTIKKYFSGQLEVVEAVNGREAAKFFTEKDCKIALLDIEMPGVNGLEAAEQIREKDRDCSIIFLTAFDEFSYAKRAISVHALDYLLKPGTEEELVAVLEEAIRLLEEKADGSQKNVREKDFDVDGFLNVLEPYYKGGEYDFLLNSDRQLDLLGKRFIVFELDNIRDNKVLLPIVTIIIMETFISKMRKLKGIRKIILIEECWKALASANMSNYIRYLFKTVRKFFGEAVVVTQEVEDIISSPIVKGTIINNSDCKILLDQRKYMNKFDEIQTLLGLTDKERAQILSINMANNPSRKYKEVWIGLGGSQSAVYATEVSLEEYVCYTTEETEKLELMRLTEKLGGNIELAIRQLADSKRSQVKGIGIT